MNNLVEILLCFFGQLRINEDYKNCQLRARSPGAHKKFLQHAYMESSITHQFRKIGRRDFK